MLCVRVGGQRTKAAVALAEDGDSVLVVGMGVLGAAHSPPAFAKELFGYRYREWS
jgi:hypothetical protein